MEILSTRIKKGNNSTLSVLRVNGNVLGWVIEDTDRGLDNAMSLEQIKARKVYAKTAIPTGRYKISINYSNRFKRQLIYFHDVKGYEGIRSHSGNYHTHTEGCLLPGAAYGFHDGDYFITGGTSRSKYEELHALVLAALKRGEEVYWTITTNY